MARLETLHSTITLEDLPDDLIDNAVQGALAPLLERQEAMENKTMARLEALQALVSSLASVVKKMFQPNVNTEPPEHGAQTPTNPSSPNAPVYHPGPTLARNSSTGSSDITGAPPCNVSPSNRHIVSESLSHSPNPPMMFPCNQCERIFRTVSTLDGHIEAIHSSLKCDIVRELLEASLFITSIFIGIIALVLQLTE